MDATNINNEPIKWMDIKEFREKGYLQEANRVFFHPLGLALAIRQNDDGTEDIAGLWDYRDDPEGIVYADNSFNNEESQNKRLFVLKELSEKFNNRQEKLGFSIQPVLLKVYEDGIA